jgi:hypothetical protein
MRVIVIFEFKEVDTDSELAHKIVADITDSCETMRIGFDADGCWIDDVEVT